MCGRFTLVRLEEFVRNLPWLLPPGDAGPARYNVAPTQAIAVVPNRAGGGEGPEAKAGVKRVEFFHWGLIPSWAKDPSVGNRMINARAETLAERPAFRTALKRRRCLVIADGFFEWRKEADGKTKTPMYIRMKSGRPFAFAGLWDVWHDPGGSSVSSCTIVTTSPNELMAPIHDRMPAIVPEGGYERWVDAAEREADELADLLAPYPAGEMVATPVGRQVNNAKFEGPECIVPVEGEPAVATATKAAKRPRRRTSEEKGLFE